MEISIADLRSDAKKWAEFFASNITPEYISHFELQGCRAVAPDKWSPDLISVVEREISERLGSPTEYFPENANWQGVILCMDGARPVGIALVTCSIAAATPFGIIEDIVVDAEARGHGLGERMMRWIIERFKRAAIDRVFLESGVSNERAHELFRRLEFEQVSMVMMRDSRS